MGKFIIVAGDDNKKVEVDDEYFTHHSIFCDFFTDIPRELKQILDANTIDFIKEKEIDKNNPCSINKSMLGL